MTVKHVGQVPYRYPAGPVTWDAIGKMMSTWQREIFAAFDIRNGNTRFAGGIVANDDEVTLGDQAIPDGRTVGVPTLTGLLSDAGRAASQRFLWPVNVANRNSVQSTASVLTATSGTATSTIDIAAHSVKYDFGTVAYGAGSITGLTPETVYYVYADDPNFAGAAVTYLATTNPDNLIAQGRYYVGFVTTPVTGTAADIIAASSASPIVFQTALAHGWTTGDEVSLAALPGAFAVLNGNDYTITVIDTDEFSIAVDGSAFAAYVGPAGTATRVTTAFQSGGGAGGGVGGNRWDFVLPP